MVVQFTASYCEPCQYITPYLESFAQKYAEKIVILSVDVDKLNDLAKYGVKYLSAFVFLKNGRVVKKFFGSNSGKIEKYIIKLSS